MWFNTEEIPTLDILIKDTLEIVSDEFVAYRRVILSSLLTIVVACTIYLSGQNAKTQKQLVELMTKVQRAKTTRSEVNHYKLVLENLDYLEEIARLKQDLQRVLSELSNKSKPILKNSLDLLQKWLQLTYELEIKSHNKRVTSIEIFVETAVHISQKMKKSTILRPSHIDLSEDTINNFIIRATAAKENSVSNFDTTIQRWMEIESALGLPIIQNPGQATLRLDLNHYSSQMTGNPEGPFADVPQGQTFRTRAARIRSTLKIIKFFKKKRTYQVLERQISKSIDKNKRAVSSAFINRFALQDKLALKNDTKR